jgi:hypothetical protein
LIIRIKAVIRKTQKASSSPGGEGGLISRQAHAIERINPRKTKKAL